MAGTRAYEVVVCDQLLPGEQGLDFLMRAAEQFPAMRRILITGYMNPSCSPAGSRLAGLSSYLLKPTAPDELRQAIYRALAK